LKILIIHPEGNIHNNSNLVGIVEVLCDSGYTVEVISPRRPEIHQGTLCRGARMTLVDINWRQGPFIFVNLAQAEIDNMPDTVNSRIGDCDFIFGVDTGIIEASLIARVKNIPFGLISYEIFFADEAGQKFKQWEIHACKGVDLAICQDDVRCKYLSDENRIPLEIIYKIPVVGRGYRHRENSTYLRERFNVPNDKRIALYIGSLDEWSMSEYLIKSAIEWPKGWCLILHNRYQGEPFAQSLFTKYKDHPRIIFSREPFSRLDDMDDFISSADVGISLYKALYNSIYSGKNIASIGMASGKTNVYLQHGLPVITNDKGVLGQFICDNSIGVVVDTDNPFLLDDNLMDLEEMRANIPGAYNRYLNLDLLMSGVLCKIRALSSV